jgi:cell wall-associated NlpC family hydrolase
MREFNHEFERLTEDYNDARILLRKREAEAKAAAAREKASKAEYAAMSGRLRQVVRSAYRSVPFARFGSMLSSGSPTEFLEQLSALDAVTGRRAAVVDRAGRAKAAATKATADARTAVAEADKVLRDLTGRRSDLKKRAAESKRLFDRLSARERAAFLAQPHGVETRASRSTPRGAPVAAPAPAPAPAPRTVPASGRAATAVATAKAQLGKPYVWAAAGPNAFDCSGLTMYSWAAAGVSLPHSSRMQLGVGSQVSRGSLQPGDLVFFYSPISHVGIYVGNGMMIHAPTSGDVVKYASIGNMPFAGASRPG